MGTGSQVLDSAIQTQGTDHVLAFFNDKLILGCVVVLLVYLLGKSHGIIRSIQSGGTPKTY